MSTDIVITLVGYLVTVGVVLLWVFFSKQTRVARSARTAVCVSLRSLPLFLLFFLVCGQLGVSVVYGTVIVGIALWVVLIGCAGLGFDPLTLGMLSVLYVVQQWILGWPDRAEFFLDAPLSQRDRNAPLDGLVGRIGVASCPLRPAGIVALGEDRYPARSDLGYIDRGTRVQMVDRKGASLVVRPVEGESGLSGRDGPG